MNSTLPSDLEQLAAITVLLNAAPTADSALDQVMGYLHTHRRDYHWVGIYRLASDHLTIGPYRGPKTDHARIQIGQGVCGTAVAQGRNQIVGDVRELSNYLACNLETRSEIVVLIRHPTSQVILGQIDVDGTRVNQFSPAEELFLGDVAALLAPYLG
jgi:GAF domain-containing protein